jgi:peptidoglycan hydrolase CwlO-like protein
MSFDAESTNRTKPLQTSAPAWSLGVAAITGSLVLLRPFYETHLEQDGLSDKVVGLEQQITIMNETTANLSKVQSSLMIQVDKLQTERNGLQEEINLLKFRLANETTNREKLETELKAKEERIKELESKLNALAINNRASFNNPVSSVPN